MLTRPMDAAAFRWIAVRTDQYGAGGPTAPRAESFQGGVRAGAGYAGFPYTSRVRDAVNGPLRKAVFSLRTLSKGRKRCTKWQLPYRMLGPHRILVR